MTTEVTATPGPWGAVIGEAYPDSGEAPYVALGVSADGTFADRIVAVALGETEEEAQANACLIAAAHPMLAALEGLLGEMDELGEGGGQRADDARLAIAQARGETR